MKMKSILIIRICYEKQEVYEMNYLYFNQVSNVRASLFNVRRNIEVNNLYLDMFLYSNR